MAGEAPLIYKDTGGNRQVVESGGEILIKSGGTVTIEAGGTFANAGTEAHTGTQTFDDIVGNDSALGIAGKADAQGGDVVVTGGASSTTGNAGGVGKIAGGAAGATGVGGKAQVVGAAGGATSGKGGAAEVTAGAGTAGDGAGGSVIVTAGAKNGTGLDGGVFQRGGSYFRKQAAPGAGSDQAEVLTAAMMINGIFVHTVATGRTLTTPTGANISAGCPTDLAVGDSFDFTVITLGSGADDISTLTAGDGNVTFVGKVTVGPETAAIANYGTWRFRNTGTSTWIGYRIG